MIKRLLVFTTLLFCICTDALAWQYKSRLFDDSDKYLSRSEQQNIAALEAAFGNYQDSYQIATTGQYLARQMVANKEFQKAADYYAKALQAQALDPLIQTELTREYAQVLLLLERYSDVLIIFNVEAFNETAFNQAAFSETGSNKGPLQIADRLVLARASLGLAQFHKVIEWLQPVHQQLGQNSLLLEDATIRQLAAIYFQAKALPLAAQAVGQLLNRHPEDVELARQLTGLYIRLESFGQALDLWSLTFTRGLISNEQDMLLLADLYTRQGAPEKAARLLMQGLEETRIAETAPHYYKLFEFWYQAKELQPARDALWQSVKRSQSIEHGLILTELLQQAQQWQQMYDLIMFACQAVLPDRYVGRINLMQGIALHKLENNILARRAFINASLVSGVKTQARKWLNFIVAKPATLDESRRLWGDCLPQDASIELPDDVSEQNIAQTNTSQKSSNAEEQSSVSEDQSSNANVQQPLEIITLPGTRFYGTRLKTSAQTMAMDMKRKTFNLVKNLVRSGGKVDGNMHLLFNELQTAQNIDVTIAFPFSAVPSNRGGHKVIRIPKSRAITKNYNGPAQDLATQWQSLLAAAISQKEVPTGQARMVFLADTTGSINLDVQLQLLIE